MTGEVETQRAAARQSATLRKRLDEAVEGASFLAHARSERPRMIDLLNDLSECLPDGTWLERLNTADHRVIVVGYRSEERLVGQECVSTCRYGCVLYY